MLPACAFNYLTIKVCPYLKFSGNFVQKSPATPNIYHLRTKICQRVILQPEDQFHQHRGVEFINKPKGLKVAKEYQRPIGLMFHRLVG